MVEKELLRFSVIHFLVGRYTFVYELFYYPYKEVVWLCVITRKSAQMGGQMGSIGQTEVRRKELRDMKMKTAGIL